MTNKRQMFGFRASPNFDDRNPLFPVQYIIIHYTGMKSDEEWLTAVCDPTVKLSAHYLITENGRIIQLVDESKRAWHAGKSFWQGITDLNSSSIGIELSNPGHEHGYLPFPSAQIVALKELLQDIINRYSMHAETALLAHSDIAPVRKQDPGELFPWRELAYEGLGLWPESRPEYFRIFEDTEVVMMLRNVGYYCPGKDLDNPESRAALIAFQRRYNPESLTGTPDAETSARLLALTELLKVYRRVE